MENNYATAVKAAHEAVKDYYISRDTAHPVEGGIADIEVSYDGTWMTCGHKSYIGIGFMIDVYTGLVDFEVLCSFCPACNREKTNK